MSRSKRKPSYYVCCGANPRKGKQLASRSIRSIVRQKLHTEEEDFDFAHPQDKIRGDAGSRSEDYGWTYFGDGKVNPYKVAGWARDDEDSIEWINKLKRK